MLTNVLSANYELFEHLLLLKIKYFYFILVAENKPIFNQRDFTECAKEVVSGFGNVGANLAIFVSLYSQLLKSLISIVQVVNFVFWAIKLVLSVEWHPVFEKELLFANLKSFYGSGETFDHTRYRALF